MTAARWLAAVLAFVVLGPLPASWLPRAVLTLPLVWAGVVDGRVAERFVFMWGE